MALHPYSLAQFKKVLSVDVKQLQTTINKPPFYLRVSSLCHVEICSKRAKIESFNHKLARIPYGKDSALAKGKKLHAQYGQYNIDFDRDRLMANLAVYKVGRAFQKVIEIPECTIVVRGDYDDLRILTTEIGKVVSFIELKTTGKPYMWSLEIRAAIRQLQIYLWLLKDLCEQIGYPLWKRHYLEIFSQNTGALLRRISVAYDENIEKWIEAAVLQFLGLAPMTIAPYAYCSICPQQIKKECSYYFMRKESS